MLQAIRRQESHQLFSSPVLLTELADVLMRPWAGQRLSLLRRPVHDILAEYIDAVDLVRPPPDPPSITGDPDDDHVIAAAVAADAALIVTGDGDLLDLGAHAGIRIVTPAEALPLLGAA